MPAGDAAIVTDGVSGADNDRVPKFGVPAPGIMPAIVPPVSDVHKIFPAADDVDVACTFSPVIVTWSEPFMLFTAMLIVNVVLVMLPVTDVTLEPVV